MRYLLPDEALLLLCHQMGRYEFLLLFHLQKLTECYISEFLSQHHLCLHRQIFPLSLRYHLLCLCYLRFLYPLRLDQTRELFPRLLQTYLPLSESYPDTLHLFILYSNTSDYFACCIFQFYRKCSFRILFRLLTDCL